MNVKEGVKIEGFSRVRIVDPDGKIAGDSGWTGPNTIVDLGFMQYLCMSLGSEAGSKYVAYVRLGEGGAPGTTDTELESQCVGTNAIPFSKGVTAGSVANHTEQFTATFGSSDAFITTSTSEDIANIGLYDVTYHANTHGTLFAGNTYTSSTCASNQDVQITYQIRFSTPA